jgi:hypothetical protein
MRTKGGCFLSCVAQRHHQSSVSKVPPTGSRAEYQTLLQRRGVVVSSCRGNANLASSQSGTLGGNGWDWMKMCVIGNRPFVQFLKGGLIVPAFFVVGNFDPLPPTTCYNVYNAEFCSTGLPSIYRCSTGLGGLQSVINPLVGGLNTRYGGGARPSRAC